MSINRKLLIGAAILAICALGVPAAIAQPVPGGTLDPLTITKYVTPLVIPPVLFDDGGASMEANVSMRQINQQVLPAGLPATPLWAYGNPANPASFNNPSFTIEVTKDTTTTVWWFNDLVVDPEMCFKLRNKSIAKGKGPKIIESVRSDSSCDFLPHIIQDQNGNPVIDQTLLWAAPNQDCLDGTTGTDCRGASADAYTGPVPMVAHVYGAHANPGNVGFPESWWLPNAANVDCINGARYPVTPDPTDDFQCNGTFFESNEGADTANAQGLGYAIDVYSNDQPTSTLWYRDNTLGITRLNAYAAGAGFWLIRDAFDGETGLTSGTLPGPAPQLGQDPNGDIGVRGSIREIPIVIQPRSFNADGSLFYPADRAFFEGLGDGQTFADNTDLNIPFLPQADSDIAPVWNPEAFFNTMLVNGNTWPKLEVAQERYRFRLLNAADSRFLNMALFVVNEYESLGDEIPFYQIGSDQGLLPAVVRIETGFATTLPGNGTDVDSGVTAVQGSHPQQALLVGPGERADVIVDFSDLVEGDVVRMINTGPDAPFGGFPDIPADPGTTGQVMQFVVNSSLNKTDGDPSTPAPLLELNSYPGGVAPLGPSNVTQDLALLEEESALLCVEINPITGSINHVIGDPIAGCENGSVPFAPKKTVLGVDGSIFGEVQLWDDPIAQNPAVDAIETWELWNWSADAQAIHLDQAKFEIVNRENIVLGGSGVVRQSEPWETGWKDTVIAYPGEVTRIKAKFDIPGLFTWGSNILSHGDNEMMVPYCVGEAGVDCPAELFPPSP